MAKIQIKRGLQAGVERLVLAEGELAVALDTGNVYVGTTTGTMLVNPDGGIADEAVKLRNKREFAISGDGAAQPVAFDGTGNVALSLSLAQIAGLTAGTYTKLTVDTKGRVTGGTAIEVTDLPSIPTSKITGLGTAANKNVGVSAGSIPVVGDDGKLSTALMPDLSITDTYEAASQAAMLALKCQKGDVCVRTDEKKTYILAAEPASTLANWKWLQTPDQVVYTHPSYPAHTSGLYKITVDAKGHVSSVAAVAKADITALDIPAQDTVYTLPQATTSTLGGVKVGSGLVSEAGVVSVGDIDGGTF